MSGVLSGKTPPILSEGAMVVVHGYGIGYTETLLCLWIIFPWGNSKGDLIGMAFPPSEHFIYSSFEFTFFENEVINLFVKYLSIISF